MDRSPQYIDIIDYARITIPKWPYRERHLLRRSPAAADDTTARARRCHFLKDICGCRPSRPHRSCASRGTNPLRRDALDRADSVEMSMEPWHARRSKDERYRFAITRRLRLASHLRYLGVLNGVGSGRYRLEREAANFVAGQPTKMMPDRNRTGIVRNAH